MNERSRSAISIYLQSLIEDCVSLTVSYCQGTVLETFVCEIEGL